MSFSTASSLNDSSRWTSRGSVSSASSPLPSVPYDANGGDDSESSDFSSIFTPVAAVPMRKLRCVEAPVDLAESFTEVEEDVFADDIPVQKQSSGVHILRKLPFVSIMVIASVMAASYYFGIRSGHFVNERLEQVEEERQELVQSQERLLLQLAKDRRLPKENIDVVEHIQALQQELEATASSLASEKKRRKELEKEDQDAYDQYIKAAKDLAEVEEKMQGDVSKTYRTMISQSFGSGPHYAEFVVSIREGDRAVKHSFTIELASAEDMPASVFTFLQQVQRGLWNGCSFHVNAPHVLLAQPVVPDQDAEQPHSKMDRMGLARLPFPEYSDNFPHTQYTLGLGGDKLPGPNFYINKIDNTDNHKGQPCFAKVIIGTETIDRITQITGPKESPFYIEPVEMSSVRIVTDLHQVQGGTQYLAAQLMMSSLRDEH